MSPKTFKHSRFKRALNGAKKSLDEFGKIMHIIGATDGGRVPKAVETSSCDVCNHYKTPYCACDYLVSTVAVPNDPHFRIDILKTPRLYIKKPAKPIHATLQTQDQPKRDEYEDCFMFTDESFR